MQRRTPFDIWLPIAAFALLCLSSIPGAIFALAWMTVGVMAVGHHGLARFPSVYPDSRWRTGYQCACVWFYHIAWWPWYSRMFIRGTLNRYRQEASQTRSSRAAQETDWEDGLRLAPPMLKALWRRR
jgi:hypothetical protein